MLGTMFWYTKARAITGSAGGNAPQSDTSSAEASTEGDTTATNPCCVFVMGGAKHSAPQCPGLQVLL